MQQPRARMTVEDFLDWDDGSDGRHELLHGRIHAMSPERLRHLECRGAVYTALKDAISLLIDPEGRVLVHHRREGEEIRSHILASGPLRLDPPGLEMTVEELFGPG